MKKWIVGITFLLTALLLCGCAAKVDPAVKKAEDTLISTWAQLYSGSGRGDGYLEIKNTRVIHVKPNTENESFQDVDKIVEFILLSDYYESAPYYTNCGTYDSVVIYKDGRCEVMAINPIDMYRSSSYMTNFSDFIERIEDLGSLCNKAMDLT